MRPVIDLITLEPPPIVHAGVAALYTTEFYERGADAADAEGLHQPVAAGVWRSAVDDPVDGPLVRRRLPERRAPVRRVIEPAADRRATMRETRSTSIAWLSRWRRAPAVQTDLQRLDLGTPRDIAGMFVASSQTLANATRDVAPVTDDHPIQEYGRRVAARLRRTHSVFDCRGQWRRRPGVRPAWSAEGPRHSVEGLDTYLALLNLAYTAPPIAPRADRGDRCGHASDCRQRVSWGGHPCDRRNSIPS